MAREMGPVTLEESPALTASAAENGDAKRSRYAVRWLPVCSTRISCSRLRRLLSLRGRTHTRHSRCAPPSHPKVVSERLGHATIAITLDCYSHATEPMQVEAAAAVAALVIEG
jgi:integrase